jgi:hypothetical protein
LCVTRDSILAATTALTVGGLKVPFAITENIAEAGFIANLIQARVSYNLSSLIYLQAFVQYNDDADAWSSNIRFSWLNAGRTCLFVVYNDTEDLGNMLIGPQNRSLIVKYTHQFDILN